MLNLTLFSFSTSLLLSISPLLSKYNYTISHFNFKYYDTIIFYNPNQINVQKSNFNYGLGPLILSETSIYEYHDNQNISSTIEHIREKCLCVITDCTFNQIIMTNNSFINIQSQSSFYLTDCIFSSCSSQRMPFIYLKSRASKITHMCCANIKGAFSTYDDKLSTLFLNSETPANSFFKLIYSTIYSDNNVIYKAEALYFQGFCALQIQCNNISNICIRFPEFISRDKYILSIIGASCLNYQMNTLCNLDCIDFIFYLNPQNTNEAYSHYVGFSNFYDNKFGNYLIFLSLYQRTNVFICDCIFINDVDYNNYKNRFIRQHHDSITFSIINCIFDYEMSLYECFNPKFINTSIDENAIKHDLAHFVTNTACYGSFPVIAYGCKNDTCPDNRGCYYDALKFKYDDIEYTDKFHSFFDTPSPIPTHYFSASIEFTFSFIFSKTELFNHSQYFSKSKEFTDTGNFSRSNYFTGSREFSESKRFSKSKEFDQTNKFSESKCFSKSKEFDQTNKFSESKCFSKSKEFDQTNKFSESKCFSKSKEFIITREFSKSKCFSSSDDFYGSQYIIQTDISLDSNFFSKPNLFSQGYEFTFKNQFLYSTIFTHSSSFSQSNMFTESYTSNSVYSTKSSYAIPNELSTIMYFYSSSNHLLSENINTISSTENTNYIEIDSFDQSNMVKSNRKTTTQTQNNNIFGSVFLTDTYESQEKQFIYSTFSYITKSMISHLENSKEVIIKQENSPQKKNTQIVIILGIIIGIIIVICILLCLIFFYKKKQNKESSNEIKEAIQNTSNEIQIPSYEYTKKEFDQYNSDADINFWI